MSESSPTLKALDPALRERLSDLVARLGPAAAARKIGIDRHTASRAAAGWPVSFPIRQAIGIAVLSDS